MGHPLGGQDMQVGEPIRVLGKVTPLHEALFPEGSHAVVGLAKAHAQSLRQLALGPGGVGIDQAQELQVEIAIGMILERGIVITVGGGHLFLAFGQKF